MEAIGVLFALAVIGVLMLSPVFALVAFMRGNRLQRELEELALRVRDLERAPRARPAAAPTEPMPRPVKPVPAEPVPTPAAAPSVVEAPVPAAPSVVETPAVVPPREPRPPRPVAPPPGPAPDFATNLGPRLLVAAGALAVVIFLGLFVKYAWENNWVGPAGRVLFGAVTGLSLVAFGVRLLDREYRPLGQGLAGAGLAGLYVSAFAAHGFYDLVPREAAGFFMVAITASAVLLAARLDTRLLAALAWFGGYLTPVLLSTGVDKAMALFLYLALLGAGALVLDHKKPWPETLALAISGTILLYSGWFSRFFTPERFGVAAFGLLLFTAMFALGAASRQRRVLPVLIVPVVTAGLIALAGADRPLPLMVMSLGATALSVYVSRRLGLHMAGLGAFAALLPLAAWGGRFYEPEDVVYAALWLLGTAAILAVPALLWRVSDTDEAPPAGSMVVAGVALAVTGFGGLIMASETDRPVAILVFMLAYAALTILADVRRPGVELVGAVGTVLTVLGWVGEFHAPGRGGDFVLLALPMWGLFLVQRVVRGTLGATAGGAALLSQVVMATLAWSSLYNALYPERAALLGAVSVALAACYLALGLAHWRAVQAETTGDMRYVRVMLGLAATFVTIAIPVQMGLHGITLAWAFEGALLVALGVRFGSGLTRLGGYGVLALTVLRLFVRHLPLHGEEFRPVFNATFGTWLLVVIAMAVASRFLKTGEEWLASGEGVFRYGIATVALLLLFGLLTGETDRWFDLRESAALLAGDGPAAATAQLAGRMAVSVLWTVFATGLLAAGLALRSRPLFYSAYLLFAVTGFKVMLYDLGGQNPLYRMLSFLALGLLLLAGAWLNIRFRARLAEPDSAQAA